MPDAETLAAFRRQLQARLAELDGLQHTADAATATVTLDQACVGRLSRMDALQGQQMALATERPAASTAPTRHRPAHCSRRRLPLGSAGHPQAPRSLP